MYSESTSTCSTDSIDSEKILLMFNPHAFTDSSTSLSDLPEAPSQRAKRLLRIIAQKERCIKEEQLTWNGLWLCRQFVRELK